jgi:hypothetical protein
MKKMVFIPIVIMLVLGGCTNVRQTIDDDIIKEIALHLQQILRSRRTEMFFLGVQTNMVFLALEI